MSDRELTRAELTGADKAVSDVLDELNDRMYGRTSSSSYYRQFREWLARDGYLVVRAPRVWFDGDDVPAGVFTLQADEDPDDEDAITMLGVDGESCGNGNLGPLVEIVLPEDVDGIVAAAEQARAAVSSAVPGEPTEGGAANPGATGKPAKVEVEHVMDDPNLPDWGGEETDEGTPIYHAAWDSQDGSARVWAGPYAGGLTDGWALSVEAETASVLLRCSTDQLVDWAESVRKAIEDSRANLQYVEQDGGS